MDLLGKKDDNSNSPLSKTAFEEIKKIRINKNKLKISEYVYKLIHNAFIYIISQSISGVTILIIKDVKTQYTVKQHFFEENGVKKVCCGIRAGIISVNLISDLNEEISEEEYISRCRIVISRNGSLLYEQKFPEAYIAFNESKENAYPYVKQPIGLGIDPSNLPVPVGTIVYDGDLKNISEDALGLLELITNYSILIYDGFLNPDGLPELFTKLFVNTNQDEITSAKSMIESK